jgi:hypothetical protein
LPQFASVAAATHFTKMTRRWHRDGAFRRGIAAFPVLIVVEEQQIRLRGDAAFGHARARAAAGGPLGA